MTAVALLVPALWVLHVPGISQGNVVVDTADDSGVAVAIDLVFARADAALLPASFVTVVVDDAPCRLSTPAGEDVAGDGRAVRVDASCPRPARARRGTVDVDVIGLRALPAAHRMALRVVDDEGERVAVLTPAATTLMLWVGGAPSFPWALCVAVVVVLVGARRPRPLLQTVGLLCVGAGLGVFLAAIGPAGERLLVSPAIVDGVVAAFTIAGVVVDPAPRTRWLALALGVQIASAWPT